MKFDSPKMESETLPFAYSAKTGSERKKVSTKRNQSFRLPSECVNTSDCRVLKLPFHTKPKHEMVGGFNPLAISAQMRYNTCAFKTKHPNAVSRKFLT